MVERRTKQRFPIQLDLLYRVYQGRRVAKLEAGRSIDISSTGIVFRSDQDVATGTRVEVSTSWPALLHGTCALRWVVFGSVVRSQGGVTACSIDRYEFKTQGRSVPSPAGYAAMVTASRDPNPIAAFAARA